MTKTLTEQWRERTLPRGAYYVNRLNEIRIYLVTYENEKNTHEIYEVIAPVPRYDEVKEMSQKIERLEFDNEALEMAHNDGKEINAELVSKTDELQQKIHILNEQNTKQYNELCKTIKRLEIATKALKEYMTFCRHPAKEALKEMKGVK